MWMLASCQKSNCPPSVRSAETLANSSEFISYRSTPILCLTRQFGRRVCRNRGSRPNRSSRQVGSYSLLDGQMSLAGPQIFRPADPGPRLKSQKGTHGLRRAALPTPPPYTPADGNDPHTIPIQCVIGHPLSHSDLSLKIPHAP